MSWLGVAQSIAAVIVLAEGLNKLHRCDPFAGRRGLARLQALGWLLVPWRWQRVAAVTAVKALGWALLTVGAFAWLLAPPAGAQALVLVGFALLIVRSRMKEG